MKLRLLAAISLILLAIIAIQTLLVPRQDLDPPVPSPTPTDMATVLAALPTRTVAPTFTLTPAPTLTPTPTITSTPSPTATLTPTLQPAIANKIGGVLVNLRAGPDTDYAILTQLAGGEEVEMMGRTEAGDWVLIQSAEGTSGWLFVDLFENDADIEVLPIKTPDPAILSLAVVSAELVNLRSGPGAGYEILTQLEEGQTLEVSGRNEAGDWLAVVFEGEPGWLFLELATYNGSVEALQVITPPPSPTPRPATATPKPIALAAAVPSGSARVQRKVLANYFAWFDNSSWDACNISAGDKPLQRYHSDDPEAIGRHVGMAIAAGINGFTLQWASPGDRTDRNFATLLNKSQGTDFQSTVIFLRHIWPGANQGNTIEAIRHLQNQYGSHPNFLKINGRPVLFFTDVPRIPRAEGQSAKQAWASVRAQVDPGKQFWWIAEGLDASYLSVFDGLWVYKVSHAAYPNDYVKASRWANSVRSWEQRTGEPKLWVGTLIPGWDDRNAGCRPDIRVPSQPFVRDREGGNFYRATYNAAVKSNPDILWIHSFNEWVEGSYIEPSQYYGDGYMNMTRDMANQFRGG